MAVEEGKYIYCVIESNEGRNFGPLGIGGRGDVVSTIGYQDLTAVISDTPMTKYVLSRENMMAHTKVIEEVMKDYTVLPMRFCTIATNAEDVRHLLRIRYLEFQSLLKDMDNKIELGVKAFWRDMKIIFKEIVDENKEIKKAKERAAKSSAASRSERMAIGEMVKDALEEKRKKEAEEIVDVLKRSSVDFRTNKLMGDKMLLNAAFLVDRGRVREFDSLMDDLTAKYKERIKFKYVGPVPPYNFVNIVVHWTGRD